MLATRSSPLRQITSFVRREGRITPSQKKALNDLWPKYGLELPRPGEHQALDFKLLFGRKAPTILEVGFGDGDVLLELAGRQADKNFLGAEVYRSGVGRLMIRLDRDDINNVKLVADDAVELLRNHIAPNSLQAIHLFFPDPWPKKKHHKRRIVNDDFIGLVHSRLKKKGLFHFATDWEPYAEWSLAVLEQTSGLVNMAGKGHFSPRPNYRPITKFEKRGYRLGHSSWDLIYEKSK